MKRFLALLLALALLFAFAACRKTPARGGEETTAEITTTQATTQETTSAYTLFPFPAPPAAATEAGGGVYYEAYEAPIYTPNYSPYPEPPQPTYLTPTADLNTAAITTYSGTAGTTGATASGTATTGEPTTSGPTTTAPATTQTTTQPPKVTQGTFTVSVAAAKAAGSAVTERVTTVNSVGTAKDRVFTGVKLKDFLAAQNVDIAALDQSATLVARADDGETATYTYYDIIADRTLLAWDDDGESLSPPRLCPCNAIDASRYLQGVISVTLK